MKNIVLIIGARPNFMKAFPVYEDLKNNFNLTMTNWSCGVGDVLNYAFEEKLYDYRMVGQTNLTPNH